MKLKNKTVLITGGGTGIGLSIAEALYKRGNKILICGRREEKLREVKSKFPLIEYRVADLSDIAQVRSLADWTLTGFPGISILINNAGIQRKLYFSGPEAVPDPAEEVAVNFSAAVLLSSLFLGHFRKLEEAAIVNVTSGLAFAPMPVAPVYCATKAALHSFTVSLRYQLKDTAVKVVELAPPMVDTELDKGTRNTGPQAYRGIHPDIVTEEFIREFENNNIEIFIGQAKNLKVSGEGTFINRPG